MIKMATKTNGKATVTPVKDGRGYTVRLHGKVVWTCPNKYDAGVVARFLTETQYGIGGK